MKVLEVNNLQKTYPAFKLNNVSFSVDKGKITGFIGRNGAGKSTTLKSMLDFVNPDSGEIQFFGENYKNNQLDIKSRIGYVSGGVDYYTKKKISAISAVTKTFYKNWDDNAYKKYIKLFSLDEKKTPSELSAGMKVKYALTLALSHNAEFLILDEPTSGLDPVSRDELLDIFMDLCDKGVTIFFSTHITSDLDKSADNIVYIKNGEIIADGNLNSFVNSYGIITVDSSDITEELKQRALGIRRNKNGNTALIKSEDKDFFNVFNPQKTNLEEIMVHIEKEDF